MRSIGSADILRPNAAAFFFHHGGSDPAAAHPFSIIPITKES
jgi:hypothetical protein